MCDAAASGDMARPLRPACTGEETKEGDDEDEDEAEAEARRRRVGMSIAREPGNIEDDDDADDGAVLSVPSHAFCD